MSLKTFGLLADLKADDVNAAIIQMLRRRANENIQWRLPIELSKAFHTAWIDANEVIP